MNTNFNLTQLVSFAFLNEILLQFKYKCSQFSKLTIKILCEYKFYIIITFFCLRTNSVQVINIIIFNHIKVVGKCQREAELE